MNRLHCVSIISCNDRTAEGRLLTFDPTNMLRSLADKVRSADGLTWMIGAVDLSLNDDTQKGLGICWQPQIYAIARLADADGKGSFEILRKSYTADKTAHRPVQVKPFDGSVKAIAYAYKPDFLLRIAYQKEVGPPEKRRKCWHTRKVSLRPGEHVQAMLWMHKNGLAGRLFLKGIRMTRKGTSVGLVQIKMKKSE
jgi:hypothetical protein